MFNGRSFQFAFNIVLVVIVSFGLLQSCKTSNNKVTSQPQQKTVDAIVSKAAKGDTISKSGAMLAVIDNAVKHDSLLKVLHPEYLKVYYRTDIDGKFIELRDRNYSFPDSATDVLNLFFNGNGKPISCVYVPYDYDGGGDIAYEFTHYFNDNGNTICYKEFRGSFSECLIEGERDVAIHEVYIAYYNNSFREKLSEYHLTDHNGLPLDSSKGCSFSKYTYEFGDKAYGTIKLIPILKGVDLKL